MDMFLMKKTYIGVIERKLPKSTFVVGTERT